MNFTVDDITTLVGNTLQNIPNVYAAVLMGSCSRGEESWFTNENGERRLLSDYEFMVFIDESSSISEIDSKLTVLRAYLCKNTNSPFFNLEWSYYPVKKLPIMDKRFINFEMKTANYLICGNPRVFGIMPNITVRNLNFAELNSVVNHRLYHVLKDFDKIDEHNRRYLIARNTLDVTSVVLPYEGQLLCSYRKRIEAFPEKLYGTEFDSELKTRFVDYFAMKLDYSSELFDKMDSVEMLRWFISDMESLYKYQTKRQYGNAFCVSWRLVFKAIMKLDFNGVRKMLKRPEEEKQLYCDMMKFLADRDFDEIKVKEIQSRVKDIYGYC